MIILIDAVAFSISASSARPQFLPTGLGWSSSAPTVGRIMRWLSLFHLCVVMRVTRQSQQSGAFSHSANTKTKLCRKGMADVLNSPKRKPCQWRLMVAVQWNDAFLLLVSKTFNLLSHRSSSKSEAYPVKTITVYFSTVFLISGC